MAVWVALLYSVVLTPGRRVTSADLTGVATALGFGAARTVLSTGNLILAAEGEEDGLTALIEAEVERALGRPIPVLLRNAADWRALVAANPWPDQSRQDPAKVAVRVMRRMPAPETLARMAAIAAPDESFAVTDRALWVAGPRQLTTSPLLRVMAGSKAGIGTFRNASAIAKIAEALDFAG